MYNWTTLLCFDDFCLPPPASLHHRGSRRWEERLQKWDEMGQGQRAQRRGSPAQGRRIAVLENAVSVLRAARVCRRARLETASEQISRIHGDGEIFHAHAQFTLHTFATTKSIICLRKKAHFYCFRSGSRIN